MSRLSYRFTMEEYEAKMREVVRKGYDWAVVKFKLDERPEEKIWKMIDDEVDRWGNARIHNDFSLKRMFFQDANDPKDWEWSFDECYYMNFLIDNLLIGINIARKLDYRTDTFEKALKKDFWSFIQEELR